MRPQFTLSAAFVMTVLTLSGLLSAPRAEAQLIGPATKGVGESIEIGTSTNEIAITPDFAGADLVVFGSLDNADRYLLAVGQYDIAVALEGPKKDVTVRRKERVLGIWVNRHSETFEHVPQSYSLASTRKVEGFDGLLPLEAPGVGINRIPLIPTDFAPDTAQTDQFRSAFKRLMSANGLFHQDAGGVSFVSPTLFKATLKLPANIPNGMHTVRATLFKSGQVVMEKTLPLRVVKTGLEQAIADAAHERPFSYGVFSVLLAVITGWTASILFRRD